MKKIILIVDDNQEMLLSLKDGLEKYGDTFSVILAGDGTVAVKILKENPISMVVTDLKMPKMDGFSLLAHIMGDYPDIPVIIMTAYGTPEIGKHALEGGASGYIEKPFMIEDLAKRIMTSLRKESEGGTLHGVSLGMFLQLIEMEEKTCTIRVTEKTSAEQGVLFFSEGRLIDARCNHLKTEEAAYQIFAWDEVNISIQNSCPAMTKKIQGELQAILLEAMRLKDEAMKPRIRTVGPKKIVPIPKTSGERPSEGSDFIQVIQEKLKRDIGEKSGLEDIYLDSSWNELTLEIMKIASFFDAGKMKIVFLDRNEPADYILLPGGEKTITVMVNPKCPRDRLIQSLSD